MSKLQSWERDNSDVNGSQIKGQWGSHNAELLALIKWLVSVFMAALLLLHKGRKELIHRWPLTRPGSPDTTRCLTWVWGLQLIIFPSKHFMGLIETFIRDKKNPRSTWISRRTLGPRTIHGPSPKLVSVSVNVSAVSVSQVAALQRTN